MAPVDNWTIIDGGLQKLFSYRAESHQFGRPFCSYVREFKQNAVNWGSVLVRQYDASDGTH